MTALDHTPVTALRGVGAQMRDKLARIGITTIQDVLFHLPLRYMDRTRLSPIGSLQANAEVVIEGQVMGTDVVYGRRRSLMCKVQDRTGIVTLRFFHFNVAQRNNLTAGTAIRCYGEVRHGKAGLELYHPEYQLLDDSTPAPLAQHLTPVYPASEGLTQYRLRSIAEQALTCIDDNNLAELLPAELNSDQTDNGGLLRKNQPSLADALRFLHAPPAEAPLQLLAEGKHPAQQRLALEELLAHHLSLLRLRLQIRQHRAPALKPANSLTRKFLCALPFKLTAAQQKVGREIAADIAQPIPMLRLLQGDVGSGKTVVAALAALQAINSGYQAAIMAPTEILAEQHRLNFDNWFSPLGIKIAWLTGKQKGKARQVILETLADGSAQIIIGTHALFQEDVRFHKLGLTIIDEQHRFGVQQRLALREKGFSEGLIPHQLIMTATPIPRTLAMSVYADLDFSVIDELPAGRIPINTVAISDQRRDEVIDRIRSACGEGQQAYWVCTLIEESDVLEAQAAEVTASELRLLLPELHMGLVHGRLKPGEKAQVMNAFKAGELDLLVATTVIEVGVDVPNASLMIIENPERLGLAQLHQLRGRVGRGSIASHCVLLYATPLSQRARDRIAIMRQTNDGFVIAEEDLKIRGPGEVLGTRQTGELNLRIANLARDAYLLDQVKATANALLHNTPDKVAPIIRRWLGENERYGQV
ncbi:MAG: ATP-dependent DNA helicase RecG [Gammaproteobacteria bacterium]|nr:MAG: ATP-dependent DNA helicase RecG [Gammaproteobacteria bacterium]RLA54345.1 MAG: ATP-dependent DNA helicase RecG [Gammaproteobacteria bacterium]